MKNLINPQNMNLKKGTLLFLLLACLAYTTLAQTNYTLQGSDVTIDDGVITVCGCTFDNKRILIPKKIGDITITGIGKDAFKDKSLVAVVFEEGSKVTTIGFSAFQTNQIATLIIPNDAQLTTIEDWAFQSNQIAALTLPKGLTTIGEYAFWTNQIATLIIPNDAQLTTIGESAFQDNQIAALTLPTSLTTIEDWAFRNNSLTTVTFDDYPNKSRIKSIGINAFSGNTGLTGITLPNHAEGDDVRYKDSEGNDYDPNSVDKNTFTDFTRSLVAVLPPHTLTADDVEVDGEGIITKCHCTFLSNSIIIPVQIDGKTITGIVDKIWLDKGVFQEKNLIAVAFAGGSQITSIGNNAFRTNQITKLTLPTTLKTIGNSAFLDNQITKLTFPDDSQLTSIGQSAFLENPLPSFILPSVTIEGYRTYWQDGDSKDLETNLTIPKADFGKSFELVSIEQFTLTVGVNDKEGGSIEPSDDHFVIDKADPPSTQELTATPNEGWRFDKWVIGSNEITNNPTDVTVDADKTATAHFVQLVTLTTAVAEQQGGTIAPLIDPNGKVYDINTKVELTATPADGWRFDKWVISDEQEKTDKITTITLNTDKTATAYFVQLVTLTTAVAEQQGGTISANPNPYLDNQYDIKIKVELTATPTAGWRFDKWVISDEQDKTDKTTTITLDADKSVTAHFVEIVTLTVEVNNEEGGSIEPSDDHFVIDKADAPSTQELTATPNEGWRFDKWVIGSNEITNNPTDVTVDADKTATAHFVQLVTLTTAVAEQQGGTIAPLIDPNGKVYDINTKVELTATPNDGWRFDKWVIGSEDITDNPTTITLDKNKSVTAYFVQLVTLTTAVAEQQGGTISANPNPYLDNQYDINTEVTLTAEHNTGWRFDKWVITGEDNKKEKTTTITLNTDKTATAHFVEIVTLTVEVNDKEGGSIEPSDDRFVIDKADAPSTQDLTAKPNTGWRFDKWVISDEEDKNDKVTITLDQDKTATAHFVQLVTLTTAVAEQQGGTIAPLIDPNGKVYDINTVVELTATPNEGWKFDKWEISDEENKTDETTTITLDQDKTVTAHFVEIVTLTVEVNNEEGGSIEPSDDHFVIDKADAPSTQELTATPNDGWRFDKWVIGSEDITDNPATITLDQDKTVTAHFVKEEEEEAITSILTEVVSATPYPNPVTSQITLKAKDGDLIQLFSQKGKQQYSTQHTGNEVHIIDVSTIPVGVYLVRITDAEGNTTTKRILKK